jgi:hypothetical protein
MLFMFDIKKIPIFVAVSLGLALVYLIGTALYYRPMVHTQSSGEFLVTPPGNCGKTRTLIHEGIGMASEDDLKKARKSDV